MQSIPCRIGVCTVVGLYCPNLTQKYVDIKDDFWGCPLEWGLIKIKLKSILEGYSRIIILLLFILCLES